MPDPSPLDLLTVEQLAALLQVPPSTIYQWRYLNQGPPGFKVGRHLRFEKSDVETWLNTLRSKERDLRDRRGRYEL